MLIPFISLAGKDKDKFKVGDVDREQLEMKKSEKFPDAGALILRDKGNTYIYLTSRGKLQVVHERHVRIKILKKNGFKHAEFNVGLYKGPQSEDEELVKVKAYTFNLEDGEIEKTRLRKRNIVKEKVSDKWEVEKFTMPQVRVGSVVDVYYKTVSPYLYNFENWAFQHEIPVKLSEYRASIPEWYSYNITMKGYEDVKAEPVKHEVEWLYFEGERMQEDFKVYNYTAKNVPPIKEEPYMTTKENFITQVKFEIHSVHYPAQPIEYLTRNWADVSKELLDNGDFGRQLTRNHLRSEANMIESQAGSLLAKALMARQLIAGKMHYNGRDRLFPRYGNIRRSYKEGEGNSADLNINLIALLNKLGIQAKPVVLSTRSNGYIFPGHASIESLNYVLAMVQTEKGRLFLDATEPLLPAGYVPEKCLNGRGVVLDEENPSWVNIRSGESYSVKSNIMVEYSADSVQMQQKAEYSGFTGFQLRDMIKSKGKEKLRKKIVEEEFPEWDVKTLTISDVDSVNKPLSVKTNMAKETLYNGDESMLYINAMYGDYIDENPFKIKERKFPVDFACPRHFKHRIILTLPEGYTVHTLPKATNVALPEKVAKFLYVAQNYNGKVVIQTSLDVDQVMFNQQAYPMIKALYQRMVDKYNEKIVLKKM